MSKVMEGNVDKAGNLVRQFRQDFEREQAEAAAAEAVQRPSGGSRKSCAARSMIPILMKTARTR